MSSRFIYLVSRDNKPDIAFVCLASAEGYKTRMDEVMKLIKPTVLEIKEIELLGEIK